MIVQGAGFRFNRDLRGDYGYHIGIKARPTGFNGSLLCGCGLGELKPIRKTLRNKNEEDREIVVELSCSDCKSSVFEIEILSPLFELDCKIEKLAA